MSHDQVAVGEIPQEPPAFQPRAGLLADLDRVRTASPAVYLLTGSPGTGKTQLAAAYARAKLAMGWRLVAWVHAGSTATLLAGLAAAADAAGLPDSGPGRNMADLGQAVRRRLEGDGDRCLLVLDGAEDLAALRPFLPACGAARVLVTSRCPAGAGLGTSIPVGATTPEEAVAFLADRTGLADDDGAAAVAAELGYLPLALAQAGAVIATRQLEYRAYLERLHTTLPGEEPGQKDRKEALPYPPCAMKTATLSLDALQVADETETATRVVAIMAVLSTAGIRRDLLYAAGQAGVLAPGGRRVAAGAVDDALAELATRSLLTLSLDGRTVVMHQMMAGATRSWLAGLGQLMAAEQAAVTLLEARARDLDVERDRSAARDLAEQVTSFLGHAAIPAGMVGERLTRGLLRLRFLTLHHLIELGDSAPQAVVVGEPLAADLERMLGPGHPDTLDVRNDLAAAYLAAGRTAEAVEMFERTLVSRERTLGPDHPDTLTSQNSLASAYQDVGRVAQAIMLFRLTLTAREQLLGADHPDTLNSRDNLAAAYRAARAVPLLKQSVAGWDKASQEANPPPETPPSPDPPEASDPEPRPPAIAVSEAAIQDAGAEKETPDEETAAEKADLTEKAEPEATGEAEAAGGAEGNAAHESASSPVPVPEMPRPQPSAGSGQPVVRPWAHKRLRLPWVAVAVLVLIVASGAVGALSRLHSGGRSPGHVKAVRTEPADAAQMAANWVSQQVSRNVTVACDPLMCAALEARGVPTSRLLPLRTGTASPRGAGVVVVTPAIRSQFGSRLDSQYAPSVIAGFGSGPSQVEVQVVAPDGAAAYRAELRQDQAARKEAGTQLLANKQIGVTAQARTQLAVGTVDSRLLILLPALAAAHPIQVQAFGDSGPGAGPDIPLCTADLSGSGRAAGMTDAAYQSWLISYVRPQLAHFAGSVVTVRQGGQAVVRVQFSPPSPLGLLST